MLIASNQPIFQRGDTDNAPTQFKEIDETKTVTRFFPKPVRLTLPGHVVRQFPAGMQEIPEELADDPWLKANGVIEYKNDGPLPMQPQATVGSHAYATAFAASGVYDATLVPETVYTDEDIKMAEAVELNAREGVRMAEENYENAQRIHQGAVDALNGARARREKANAEYVSSGAAGSGNSRLTPSQQRALDKKRGNVDTGVDKLSPEDKAKFDAMSDKDKAAFIKADDAERAVMLAAASA